MHLSKAVLSSAAYVPAIMVPIEYQDSGLGSLPWHVL